WECNERLCGRLGIYDRESRSDRSGGIEMLQVLAEKVAVRVVVRSDEEKAGGVGHCSPVECIVVPDGLTETQSGDRLHDVPGIREATERGTRHVVVVT